MAILGRPGPAKSATPTVATKAKVGNILCGLVRAHTMLRVAPKRKHTATSTHDDQVIEALKSSLIKLISCKWLRAQGKGFILPRCQELPDDAALSPEEAVEMFASNNRRVATLSYGWLTPQHPDPFGTRIAILIAFLNSEEGRNYDGLFLDF